MKSDNKGFKDLEAQMAALTQQASKLSASLATVSIGKQSNQNHPDSFSKHLDSIRGALAGLTKEAQGFHKELSQGGQATLNNYSRTLARIPQSGGWTGSAGSNGGMGLARYGGGGGMIGYGAPPGAISANGSGGGNLGSGMGNGFVGPGAPTWKPNVNWANVAGGLGAVGAAWGTFGGLVSGAGDYATASKFGGLENSNRSESGYNSARAMAKSGQLGIVMGNTVGFGDGKQGLNPDGSVQRNIVGNGLGVLNRTLDDTTNIDDKLKGAVMQNTSGGIMNAAKIVGGVAIGAAGAATGIGAPFAAGLGGGLASSGFSGLANNKQQQQMLEQKIQSGEAMAMAGEEGSHSLSLMSQTAKNRAAIEGLEVGKATAGLRAHASRTMGGDSAALRMISRGGGMGFDAGQTVAMSGALRGQFGDREAQHLTPQVMGLTNKGFDSQAAGGILGRMAETGGSGTQLLEKVIASGMKNGLKEADITFFQKIGEAVAANTIGANGMTGNTLGALYSSDVGRGPGAGRRIDENIRGVGLMDRIQQSNPFMASRNLGSASTIMGDGSSIEEIETLANASFADLASAASGKQDPNNSLSIFGIGQGQAQKALADRSKRLGSVLSSGNSAPAKRLAKLLEGTGGDLFAALKGNEGAQRDAAALGKSRLGGGDLMDFEGGMRSIGGLSDLDSFNAGKGGLKNQVSGTATSAINMQVQNMMTDLKTLSTTLKTVGDVFAAGAASYKRLTEEAGAPGDANQKMLNILNENAAAAGLQLAVMTSASNMATDALARLAGKEAVKAINEMKKNMPADVQAAPQGQPYRPARADNK